MQAVAEPNTIDIFVEKTNLIPAIVLDGVAGEICNFLDADPAVNQIYETLRNEDTLKAIEDKTAHAFANSAGFKKTVSVADPRPGYYSFMRHWLSGVLKEQFPAQYQKLPGTFRNGQPL